MHTSHNRQSRSNFRASGRPQNSSRSQHKYGQGSRRRHLGRGGGGRKTPIFNPSQFINTNPVNKAEDALAYIQKNTTFNTFGLAKHLINTIGSLEMNIPTPIQDQIIPHVLLGKDVVGLAETGTGKTAAFLIPLIEKNIKWPNRQTLILAPTRELALQIQEELHRLSRGLNIFSALCVGGVNIRPQITTLRRPHNHFVIATPGRILDLMRNRHFIPTKVSTVVLDEADRMLDMGFIKDVRAILSKTPQKRETLFFSATMTPNAKKLVHDFLKNPIMVSVKKQDIARSIDQNVIPYEPHSKFDTLTSLLNKPEFKRVLIFGSMKHSVKQLAKQLLSQHIRADSIHGNKSHGQRQHALNRFKTGAIRILVATDVAARGIHVEDITHVINYDLPNSFENYVHRIGRTGRGAKYGKALTFVPKR